MRLPKNPVLFVGAHTDDIELFAGGFCARLARENHRQVWRTFSSHKGITDHVLASKEHRQNAASLGAGRVDWFLGDYAAVNGEFQLRRQEIYDVIVQHVQTEAVRMVVTHPDDTNQDHQQVLLECRRALKGVCTLVSGEYPFNQLDGRVPDLYVKLDEADVKAKVDMIMNYDSQKAPHRKYFDPAVWWGLARLRGAQVGVEFAEAYFTQRIVIG